MSDLFDVRKEIILITGASQGLGRQFARAANAQKGTGRVLCNPPRTERRVKENGPISATPLFTALRQAKSLKDAFVVACSLVKKREVRERFEPSNPLMAGGENVQPLLISRLERPATLAADACVPKTASVLI